MEVCRKSSWLILPLLVVILLAGALHDVQAEIEIDGPSECRPYIEKALRELEHVGPGDAAQSNEEFSSIENEQKSDETPSSETSDQTTETQETREENAEQADEVTQDEETETKIEASVESVDGNVNESETTETQQHSQSTEDETQSAENAAEETQPSESAESTSTETAQEEPPLAESVDESSIETRESSVETAEEIEAEETKETESVEERTTPIPDEYVETETQDSEPSEDQTTSSVEDEKPEAEEQQSDSTVEDNVEETKVESSEQELTETETEENVQEARPEDQIQEETVDEEQQQQQTESTEEQTQDGTQSGKESESTEEKSQEDTKSVEEVQTEIESKSTEDTQSIEDAKSVEETGSKEEKGTESIESQEEIKPESIDSQEHQAEEEPSAESGREKRSLDEDDTTQENTESVETPEQSVEEVKTESKSDAESNETTEKVEEVEVQQEASVEIVEDENKESQIETEEDTKSSSQEEKSSEDAPEEELIIEVEIPENLRPRDHVESLLKLDREATEKEEIVDRVSEITLRELKRLYENAIKPLETLYKYRDLSNRHYGDAEIFSKPLILFMGPWSGGKSSIINYLLNIEYNDTALRTGAEPSPAYFNLLMHGDEEEVLDGTQLAADYTFSGLQKFGQGLEERLRGVKLPNKLLEKVNIVEIPGILEVRKQVSRVFPFNDACQWFIDRADIIFLVYDPSKLDVGPETEAILDQLKGREYQTRIVLNKADQVKPEELMRVQGALIWNISPLMSSPQPPVMYTTSLWSRPYEHWAPVRLLQAQERAFLRDFRSAVDKRIENKIASARRFAVRVRNHAKMVDCYLTTYYNHKSIFGNRKQVSDAIIEHPQDYHIYEGLSTLTNISRYDLPDPEVYRDFFRLNPLYEFQQLSATCTYFRGCPINKLDVAIAYDLPELVGKHKRLVEAALAEAENTQEQGQVS